MLTVLDRDLEHQRNTTVPGMAHFAHTGPAGKCCGDCRHLMPRGALGYGCLKYRQMMGHSMRDAIPRNTPSCKYFEDRPQAK